MVMAEIPEGPAKQAGIAIGEKAAAAAMGAGGIDPAIPQPPYRPRTTPGEWIGAAPPTLEPFWLAFKPWAMTNIDALMPPPPPALTSESWARDYEEVRRLGAWLSRTLRGDGRGEPRLGLDRALLRGALEPLRQPAPPQRIGGAEAPLFAQLDLR